MSAVAKIYTKIGDQGQTQLIDGSRVRKNSQQIEAYGTLDELNAHVGLLQDKLFGDERFVVIRKQLGQIQRELFELGCELAHPKEKGNQRSEEKVGSEAVKRLEGEIDAFTKELSPLKNFILPNGILCFNPTSSNFSTAFMLVSGSTEMHRLSFMSASLVDGGQIDGKGLIVGELNKVALKYVSASSHIKIDLFNSNFILDFMLEIFTSPSKSSSKEHN